MTKSRTFRTCQNILRALVEEYGPFARVGYPLIRKKIVEVAGGDPRTERRYWQTLIEHNFIFDCREGGVYSFNWKKVVDSPQLRLPPINDK